MVEKILIKKNTNGDTRVAKGVPTFEDFQDANFDHRFEVEQTMTWLADHIELRGSQHDWTKTKYALEFYNDFCACLENGDLHFEHMPWYDEIHIKQERHHLNSRCPEDVNLIDVIEMICDCVCAGIARSGSYRPVEISNDILQKAVANTAQLLLDTMELVEEEDNDSN